MFSFCFKRLIFAVLLASSLVLFAQSPVLLNNDQPITGLSAAQNQTLRYAIDVPAGAQNLEVAISGGSGDADLYLRFGQAPTTEVYDCRPWANGNTESCTEAAPQTGRYYINIVGYNSFNGLSLVARYEGAVSSGLQNGVPVTGLAAAQGEEQVFYLDVPANAANLKVALSGGSGDADLYLRYNEAPTTTTYDCRPWRTGNTESCEEASPNQGRYYVMVRAYNSYQGVQLLASFEADGGPGGCEPTSDNAISLTMLGNGQVNELTYSSWIRSGGDVAVDYVMEICQQPQYGVVSVRGEPIVLSNGFDQAFDFSYTHLGPRASNDDQFAVRISSNGNTTVAVFDLRLNNPTVEHPVQPSCADIDVDNDGDGIPDCAEQPGRTFYGMPLYDWGARQNQTDIFIEVDYMAVHTLRDYDGNVMTDSDGNPLQDHGTQPLRESLDRVVELFAARGYAVHFDIGDLYDQAPGLDPADYDLGGGQAVPFQEYVHLNRWTDTYNGREINVPGMTEDFMPQYFENNPERLRAFYYLLVANSQGGSNRGSSGQAPDLMDYWFYLSMGGSRWRMDDDTPENRNMLINAHASTIVHELGHVIGFAHGGDPEIPYDQSQNLNFKPNYISSMNYLFQLQGVPRDYSNYTLLDNILDRYQFERGRQGVELCTDLLRERRPDNNSWGRLVNGIFSDPSQFHIDYSDGDKAPIDENAVSESGTLGGLDYDCDGSVSGANGRFDVNFSNTYDVLHDYDDWGNLTLYYRYLNYRNGKYLISPNRDAERARSPGEVINQLDLSARKDDKPVGVQEWVPPMSFFEAIHAQQKR
ncbi:pre-peptidase C-terminal domain-containing protein [Acanthopleuribacter pedis]|uniref:Pre-peptidase C-terminal domain-containing protein n=1 Tax=Acanthopleuribacter pedis TaxID=442870 RepID=A0A8J7QQJ3_9BACT|nr:pre-peptidase C-terminal domain-containing protein [Acanthopleuribacter pedis]MBO1323015.1 pre-peptidase C-terminal domain-containing protein [Acanthopleuribacter pedis]